MLGLALLLPVAAPVRAVESESGNESADYVYAIDVEFGNLSFYYDYGVWNVNTMRYEAGSTSTYPAEGTTLGFPGWYGFDDQSNFIRINNRSEPSDSSDRAVTMSLAYRALTSGELAGAGADGVVSGVSMTVSGKSAVTAINPKTVTDWNDNTITVPANATAVGYIHLSGKPVLAGSGAVYSSAAMQPIGMLILKIESWT